MQKEYIDKAEVEKFVSRLSYVPADATTGTGFDELKKAIGNSKTIRAFYLAVTPALFGDIAAQLKKHEMITPDSRIVVEKPIGRSLASAKALNDQIGSVFGEHQIFRIDHYLGKETVQNLMALRFANALYEPLWNSAHIDHVQITVAETVGLEDRVTYYDTAGALRDMVQNHILQLLCLVAMEPPSSMDANAVRDEKLKVLRSLKRDQRPGGAEVDRARPVSRRRIVRRRGEGLSRRTRQEGQHDRDLRRGEGRDRQLALGRRAVLSSGPASGWPRASRKSSSSSSRCPTTSSVKAPATCQPNQLVIRLQPDEGVKQFIMVKDPGPGGMRLRQLPLDMSFAESFDGRSPDAYERLIMDVIRGNQTLFMRRDEVEAAWTWVDPILNAWSESRQEAQGYTAGTWGPSASIALIERDGRTWHESD